MMKVPGGTWQSLAAYMELHCGTRKGGNVQRGYSQIRRKNNLFSLLIEGEGSCQEGLQRQSFSITCFSGIKLWNFYETGMEVVCADQGVKPRTFCMPHKHSEIQPSPKYLYSNLVGRISLSQQARAVGEDVNNFAMMSLLSRVPSHIGLSLCHHENPALVPLTW
jgi:hypothetical protein